MGCLIYLTRMFAGLALVWRYPLTRIHPVSVNITILAAAVLTIVDTDDVVGPLEFVGAVLVVGSLFLGSVPARTSPGQSIR